MSGEDGEVNESAWIFTWPQVKTFIKKAAHTCEVIASFGVIAAVVFFFSGQKDRETQEEASAWAAIANPRPGISIARQIEYLSKDGWFRTKSSFDNVHLVPDTGERGVSLSGLQLKDSSLNSLKADKAELKNVSIEDSDLIKISLKASDIYNSVFNKTNLIKADISNSILSKVNIFGVMTGLNLTNSLIMDSDINARLPKIKELNRSTLRRDEEHRLYANKSFIRNSKLAIEDSDEADQCGLIEMNESELYYSQINISWDREEDPSRCFIFMNKAWIIYSEILGDTGVECDNCTIAYSNIELNSLMSFDQVIADDGNINIWFHTTRFENATILKSKFFGKASGISFSNSKFVGADLSGLSAEEVNLSGAEFDVYDPDADQTSETPDRFKIIYYRGYSGSERSLDIDEREFGADLYHQETAEQTRARYPIDGFAKAWAWRDRPPRGLPDDVAGPILCDPKWRTGPDGSEVRAMPDQCKPASDNDAASRK